MPNGAMNDRRGEIPKLDRPAPPRSRVRLGLATMIGLAPFSERAGDAPRRTRQADRLPELHQRLVEIARTAAREQTFNGPLDGAAKLRLVDVPFDRAKTSRDARHVAVDHGVRLVVSDAQDGPRGVIPDARKSTRLPVVRGKAPAELAHDFLRGQMEMPRAPVVSQP